MRLPRATAYARSLRGMIASGAPLMGCACSGEQSAFRVMGHEAGVIAKLSWVMFVGAALVLLLVLVLMLYALLREPERRTGIDGSWFIFAGGVGLPVVTLTALLVYSLGATRDVRAAAPVSLEIDVIGHRWWWEVRYRGVTPDETFTTANELHLPLGARTRITVTSADVVHSFWVPSLAGKMDSIPGHENALIVRPTRTGVLRGQCAEYCGAQHTRMALYVVVSEPQTFEAWRARQRERAVIPVDPLAEAGRDLFLNAACAYCHTIRGTHAGGRLGPDLTHVGSRLSIGAGTLPATRGHLAGWIVDAQQIKPGSLMPSFRAFTGEELRAITAYLESLE